MQCDSPICVATFDFSLMLSTLDEFAFLKVADFLPTLFDQFDLMLM